MEVKNRYNCLVTEEIERTNNEVNDIEKLELEWKSLKKSIQHGNKTLPTKKKPEEQKKNG